MTDIITVSIGYTLRKKVDKVSKGNRSLFIRNAVKEKLEKMKTEEE